MSAAQFRDFAQGLGFELPANIEPGKRFRFSTNGKRGDAAGWGYLFPDERGGVVGDWRTGGEHVWQAKQERKLTPAERTTLQVKIDHEKREAQAQREREHQATAAQAKAILDAAQPATSAHPYLRRKRIPAYPGLRVGKWPQRGKDNCLLIPMRDAGGKLWNVQAIFPEQDAELGRDKDFLADGRKKGLYLSIGEPKGRVVIAEGYATGAAIVQSTGEAVAVAFDAYNLGSVAQELKRKLPSASLILAADNDTKEDKPNTGLEKAQDAAQAVGALVAVPEMGRPCDFADLFLEQGAKAVKVAIDAAKPVLAARSTEENVSGLLLRRASDVISKPVRWLWPSRIARGKVSMLAGNPGLGKSQLCASFAAIVSTGGTWPVDRTRCERGSVLIFSAEDDAEDTIRPRLEAAGADLSRVHILEAVAVREPDGSITKRAFSLVDDMPRLAAKLAELQDVALVVIDPVTAYMGETDSHKNAEVRAVLSSVGEVAAKYGTAVIAVSHLRKSAAGEAMQQITGSLAFVAAARAAYIVAKDQSDPLRRLLLPVKNNLGDDQTGYAFRIAQETLTGGIGTSRVDWEGGRVTVTAEEALAPVEAQEERSAVEEAADFLRSLLDGAPMSAKQVLSEARGAGHSDKTIRRSAKSVGVEIYKDGMQGGWLWRLAPKMAKTAEDGQASRLATFDEVGHLRESENAKSDVGERF